MTGNSAPFIWKEISNSPIKFIHCAMFPENKTENVFSTFHHHAEIVFVAWLRDLSWEIKIVYLFLQEKTSTKFLIFLLLYFPVFWLQISSTFALIFADCHGLSCVHVQASSYTALFRVSLRGVGPKCVGLARKISARCNTGSHVFPFFFVFLFSFLHYHTFMLF